MKIRSFGADLFHADGQTDRHNKTNRRSSQFCKIAYNTLLKSVLRVSNYAP